MKAIPVDVYRCVNRSDCTNGGISSRFSELLVPCDTGFLDVDEDNPPENLVKLVHRRLFGVDTWHLEPYVKPGGVGWMAGGNFAHTSDSRFSRMLEGMYGAVPIHDRQESASLYELLSR